MVGVIVDILYNQILQILVITQQYSLTDSSELGVKTDRDYLNNNTYYLYLQVNPKLLFTSHGIIACM